MQMNDVVKQIGISASMWKESMERHDVVCEEFDGVNYGKVSAMPIPNPLMLKNRLMVITSGFRVFMAAYWFFHVVRIFVHFRLTGLWIF